MNRSIKAESYQWQAIFFCFLLAALTGVLYRLGFIVPLPAELSLQNIRHAHSHLMFFGWAAAIPLYITISELQEKISYSAHGLNIMHRSIWGMLLFGLLSYPFFLLYGYHPVPVGNASMPLSVILSGLVMICWYVFITGYLWIRKKLEETDRNLWFEASLVMLFVCSLGAWGVAVAQAMDVASPLAGKALTHFFLATFTEGFVVLSVIALLDQMLEIPPENYLVSPGTLATLILFGAPLTFPYGISETLLTPLMLNTARLGGLVAGTALVIVGYVMLRFDKVSKSILLWPVVLLLLKAVMQVIASVIPSGFWFSDHALRIFYLHVLLLGALTLTGIGYLHWIKELKHNYFTGVAISVVVVLVSLLLLTRLWPIAWSGMWIYYVVAGAALLPVIAVAVEWWKLAPKSPFARMRK